VLEGPESGIRLGTVARRFDVGQALRHLCASFDVAIARGDMGASDAISVVVGGWRWHRHTRREQPFMAVLRRKGAGSGYFIEWTPRTILTTTSKAIGSSTETARHHLSEQLQRTTEHAADRLEDMAINTIRNCHSVDPAIGGDCLGVRIWLERPEVRVRYSPLSTSQFGYSPWIILAGRNGLVAPPLRMYGSMPTLNGSITVAMEVATTLLDSSGASGTSTQPRPDFPP
jgi:hypothetical protein